MEAAVRTAVEAYGRLDVMFYNAGIPEVGFGSVAFEDTTLESWNKVVAVNLTGVFLGIRAAARRFIEQRSGGTVVVTTSAASLVAYPGFRSYVAAKAGANGLVRAAATDLGKHGIRVNALCPFHGMSANFPGTARRAAGDVVRGGGRCLGQGRRRCRCATALPTCATAPASRCSWRPTSRRTCRGCASPPPTAAPSPASRLTMPGD